MYVANMMAFYCFLFTYIRSMFDFTVTVKVSIGRLRWVVGGSVAVIGGSCCDVTCARGIGCVSVLCAGQSALNWLIRSRALAPTDTR